MTKLTVTLTAAFLVCAGCAQGPSLPPCDLDNAGLTLPDGFCALVVADAKINDTTTAQLRHMSVASNGDIFAALNNGGFLVLRDEDGDGKTEVQRHHPGDRATGILLTESHLYFGTDDRIIRYAWTAGSLDPAGPAETIADSLHRTGRWHSAKGFAIDPTGSLYVNIGAPSNVCVEQPGPGVVGPDVCPMLEHSGGIWRFDASRVGQTQNADGERYVTGVRNAFAITSNPATGSIFAVQHGRDGLSTLWSDLFTTAESAEKPAEEFIRLERGQNYGWPYCYYDRERQAKVLAPEYGGDGETPGRCADMTGPVMAFPGHWAPEAVMFYTGHQFPENYQQGAFITFHGSWNRAPEPQAGYNVVFVPFAGDDPSDDFTVFATGFAGEDVSPGGAAHRPTGVATGPDGSLYIADDKGGRIYRIVYTGQD